ncbi:MAG: amidase [Betaproteobacteria bacterium]|nr:amidase [Betaproteobacteria bacterium]MDH3438695.1 amidase [Betaproteobacteria bacterium]
MNKIIANDRLGAFCGHTHIEVRGAANGPLAGRTFAVKDIYDVAGQKTGFGSPDWLRTHDPAARTAPAVQALLDAGANLVGKTLSDEMAWSLTGENAHYGTPVNVNAPGRIPGGSSSGSVSVVAAGVVDFAIGSDTGGSVRLPASFCGVIGLRPTHGRIPMEGVCPLAPSFDTCGWFARDAALFEQVGRILLRDEGTAPRPRRVLLAEDAFTLAGEVVANALKPAIARVEALIGVPQAVTVADELLAQWTGYFRLLQSAEAWAQHADWVTRVNPQFGPGVKERFAWASTVDPRAVARAKMRREDITRRMAALLEGETVLVLPSAPGIAPLTESPPQVLDDIRARALAILSIAGLARLTQVSLPLATLEGCPLGLSLIAARGNDTMLLALAKKLL